ncbi:MAG: asparagine synthase (glutamine-hydrolyzing) [Deltaproteobacteria bacterium]|nr:asparagine synthase (glutamine-hydrolyzing) [Deltaproteobacteria bacterium]
MCGFAGLVDPTGAPIDAQLLQRMTRAVAPRGPDGEGLWREGGVGLGHRRLTIIDLSSGGAQPMANAEHNVHIVFNGEIYNFMDLRVELQGLGHTFVSRSDTEVLLHAYLQWGHKVVDRIDGMFAFVVWDARSQSVFAARDRMGKKPLYYAVIPRHGAPPLLAFASELKALLLVPSLDRSVCPQALRQYLAFEYVPPPLTIVTGARKLDAAQCLSVDVSPTSDVRPRVWRYWDLPFVAQPGAMHVQTAAETLWALLTRAVERRLVADVPLGVFLSGGIDSSAVAAAMHALLGGGRGIATFSIGFSDRTYDESKHARAVAAHLGCQHHEEILDAAALLRVLPEVSRFIDEPLADASIVPTFLLSRFTRQHVAVALGGDGGDELFEGYPTFGADRWGRLFFDHTPAPFQRLVRKAAAALPARTGYFSIDFKANQFLRGGAVAGPPRHQRWMASFLPEEQEGLLTPDVLHAAPEDPFLPLQARAHETLARTARDRLMDHYARFYLPGDVNTKVDRASGAVGLEVRAPFLDTDLVSFACQLPANLRTRKGISKFVLKQALAGKLPPHILNRKKQGFGVPVAAWMKGPLQGMLQDELAPDKLTREGFFNPAVVQRLVREHSQGQRDWRKALWTLLSFERWLAAFGPGASA